MKTRIPLGEAEDLRLEFKSADSLEKPEAIGREVAAMLNSEGGDLWIGLGERDGVAVELQAISHPEKAAGSLNDSLVDRLEPSPLPEEVQIVPVSTGKGLSVLQVRVQRGQRGPYALLKNGARSYQLRIGNRLRPMSREEIFGRSPERQASPDRIERAKRRVLDARDEAQKRGRGSMWLRIEPIEPIEVDIQSPLFEELLFDPTTTGNRRSGWHFVQASERPEIKKGRIAWKSGDDFSVDIEQDGVLTCLAPLESFHYMGEDGELWPLALLEYPISAFRLARTVYRDFEPSSSVDVLADIAFFGVRGSKLRGGSILGRHWRRNAVREYPEDEEDLTRPEPLVLSLSELLTEPDRCGFRLVRRVYEAFGYREREMPREYDRESGRLVLPE